MQITVLFWMKYQSRNIAPDDAFDNLAPGAQEQNALDEEEGSSNCEKFIYFDPDQCAEPPTYDIGHDLGMSTSTNTDQDALLPGRLPQNEYLALIRSLNEKQREFYLHVVHWIKTKDEPLRVFLTGGAGVGKSVVTNTLYQTLHRHVCSLSGENPNETRILLSAPTGKAAFNINGRTLHSAFFLPVSQGYKIYKPLDTEKLNTLRVKYRNLKVIFIDEISMVGHDMLNFINLRLQQIMGTTQVFGGVSMILIGDLCQLQPVGDGWIFNDLTSAYGPLATNLWKQYFFIYELTEIMRQKDDQLFATMLNRLREGKQTEADLELLKSRICTKETARDLIELPHRGLAQSSQCW